MVDSLLQQTHPVTGQWQLWNMRSTFRTYTGVEQQIDTSIPTLEHTLEHTLESTQELIRGNTPEPILVHMLVHIQVHILVHILECTLVPNLFLIRPLPGTHTHNSSCPLLRDPPPTLYCRCVVYFCLLEVLF